MYLSPNDNQVVDNKADNFHTNFGGRRAVTKNKQVKDQDYTKPTQCAVDVKENPVDDVIRDVDDMTDAKARKREFSRRAETNDYADHNKEHFHTSEPKNRPLEDSDPVIVPDEKHHGPTIRNHFGSGQYNNNPNRGSYEGEIS